MWSLLGYFVALRYFGCFGVEAGPSDGPLGVEVATFLRWTFCALVLGSSAPENGIGFKFQHAFFSRLSTISNFDFEGQRF